MMFKYKQLLGFALLPFIFSCTHIDQIDTTKAKTNVDAYKIKRISESEVMDALNSVSLAVFDTKASNNCERAEGELDSLRNKYKFDLAFIYPAKYSPENDIEKQTLEALSYAIKENETIAPTPQKLSEEKYVYYFSQPKSECEGEADSLGVWKLSIDKAKLIQTMF